MLVGGYVDIGIAAISSAGVSTINWKGSSTSVSAMRARAIEMTRITKRVR
jgi:hypothetical protein